jgi:acid phosphatase family membrane protein YuiD
MPRRTATLYALMEARTVTALYELVSGPVFLSAFFSWFIAQLMKTVIEIIRHRSRTSSDVVTTMFWKTGGMPSSHSSLVTALATSIGFEYGVSSPMFTLSLFYGILIIRDALGVRRSAGKQAQVLNELGQELNEKLGTTLRPVKEVSGHTPTEVAVGVALGFFIAMAFSLL